MKKSVFIFIILLAAGAVQAQEPAGIEPVETPVPAEEMAPLPSSPDTADLPLRNFEAEKKQLFDTYNADKELLEKEYTGRINAMNPDMADMQGVLDKQRLIEHFETKKKLLLNAYREDNARLKSEEKAARQRQSLKPEYEDEEAEETPTSPPVVQPKPKSVENDGQADQGKRKIKPYEETSGYKKKPNVKAKDKKSSYISKSKKPTNAEKKPKKNLIPKANTQQMMNKKHQY